MLAEDARCHQCARPLRFCKPVTGNRGPRAGDPVLCGRCGGLGYLAPDGYTRAPTAAEVDCWRTAQPDTWRILENFQDEIIHGVGDN